MDIDYSRYKDLVQSFLRNQCSSLNSGFNLSALLYQSVCQQPGQIQGYEKIKFDSSWRRSVMGDLVTLFLTAKNRVHVHFESENELACEGSHRFDAYWYTPSEQRGQPNQSGLANKEVVRIRVSHEFLLCYSSALGEY